MLKPNIRGVPRGALRYRLHGWKSAQTGARIDYRLPWRRNWVEVAASTNDKHPVLSRSGVVYLVTSSSPKPGVQIRVGMKTRWVFIPLLGAVLGIGLVTLLPVQSESASQSALTAAPTPIDDRVERCNSSLISPRTEIEHWLQTGAVRNDLNFEVISKQNFGGIENRQVRISCEGQSSSFKIQLTLHQKQWQLKNFTRLEN